jgi:hypothetical protein
MGSAFLVHFSRCLYALLPRCLFQRNAKDLIKFYFVCKAFAKSGKVLKARSIAGWGSAISG